MVVVVASGLDRTRLENREVYPTLTELGRSATKFTAHRSPTTLSAGVVATLLTGVPPRAHGVEDAGARLSGALTTLGVAARDGSVQTAMFTGCPPTFEAFGFAGGWDKYAMFSPVEAAPAVAPLTEAAAWISEHMKTKDARALVIVHARGGHPPWDVTLTEATKLPPADYSGPVDARRAAQVISRARAGARPFRLTEADRTGMWALYDVGVAGQDRALGTLIDTLKKANLWDEALFVVSGDVSVDGESRGPFGDGEELAENPLHVPLWVHFPGGSHAGEIRERTDDDQRHIALGFERAQSSHPRRLRRCRPLGDGIGRAAAGRARYVGHAGGPLLRCVSAISTADRCFGQGPHALCDFIPIPTARSTGREMPRAATLLFRMTYDAEATSQKQRRPREPATVDANTAAALQVWGE